MAEPQDNSVTDARQQAASKFTTWALAKRWTKHFAMALGVVALLALAHHLWPDLVPSESDAWSSNKVNDTMEFLLPRHETSKADGETTTIRHTTDDRCEWKVTVRGERITYAHVALAATPSDLKRLSTERVEVALVAIPGDKRNIEKIEHWIVATFVSDAVRERDHIAAAEFLREAFGRFASDPALPPVSKVLGNRVLTACYDGDGEVFKISVASR